MKAIIYESYGPPEVLQVKEVPKPVPKDKEVLIKVHAVEATKADCELRKFEFPIQWFVLPLRLVMGFRKPRRQILGGYFSGEIVELGKDVRTFEVGENIYGCTEIAMGAYGEYLCLSEKHPIAPMPKNISFTEAAVVPFGGLHALELLKKAEIKQGDKVLVNGAGGSIGTFAIMLAKQAGGEVTAVDSAIKEEMLRSIGADHFVDYRMEDFTKSAKSYDVIINMVAHVDYSSCINALKPKGRYLIVNPSISDMFRSAHTSRFKDKTAKIVFAKEGKKELGELTQMIEGGGLEPRLQPRLQPHIDKIYPMTQAVEAHKRVETEERLGPVVISIAS